MENPNQKIEQDLSCSMLVVQLRVLPIVAVLLLLTILPYYLLWKNLEYETALFFKWYSLFPTLILGIIAHEFIHGLSWMYFGNVPKEQIRYGIQWKTLTPYAHCTAPLYRNAYLIGALMPLLILGLVPYLIGLATGNNWVFWFGVAFIAVASGDVYVAATLLGVAPNKKVGDHPVHAGCVVYAA